MTMPFPNAISREREIERERGGDWCGMEEVEERVREYLWEGEERT